jgi:hypothetical protein
MNLIEVQDRLNKLPALPESVQYLTAAAQGGNPQVPPFMALARIGEINKEIQRTAQGPIQPPAEPLNQSLPKQAMQSMGIGALQQGQQQQGMQQLAQQVGASQQAVPPGVPQPVRQQQPMPQGMPQQAPRPMPQGMPQQAPRGMAGGGLTSIPVDSRMFNYGSGGIVAFNGEDGDQVVEAEAGYDPQAELRKLQPQMQALLAQQAAPVRGIQGIEKQLTGNKNYGVDEGPVGKGYLEGLAALKAAKEGERGKQREEIEIRRRNAANRALLDFAAASRGQTGVGGIGALGRSYMGSTEKLMGEEAGLRDDAIKTDSLINEAKYKIQELRRAQLKGDVAAEQKADLDLAKIAKDLGVAKSTLIGRLATGNLNLMGRGVSADATVEAANARASNKGTGKPRPPSNEAEGVAAFEAELAETRPELSPAQRKAEATRLYKQSSTAPAVEARETKDINEAWRREKFTVDYMEAKDKEAYEREWRAKWKRENPQAAAPAQAAASTTPPVNLLKEGVATKFGNGQTWTLKNGKPERVK